MAEGKNLGMCGATGGRSSVLRAKGFLRSVSSSREPAREPGPRVTLKAPIFYHPLVFSVWR